MSALQLDIFITTRCCRLKRGRSYTGFLGGLTTFPTFSSEAVTLLAREQYGWASVTIFSHLAGSLAMTVLGIMTIKWLAQH